MLLPVRGTHTTRHITMCITIADLLQKKALMGAVQAYLGRRRKLRDPIRPSTNKLVTSGLFLIASYLLEASFIRLPSSSGMCFAAETGWQTARLVD